jgi:hypothetical protein
MTPAGVLAGIPAEQIQTAKALAAWLDQRGHRPSLAEIEQERQRRSASE